MGWFGASEPEQKKNYDEEIQGFNTVDKYDTGATMTASAPPPPQMAQMGGGMPQMGTRDSILLKLIKNKIQGC